jgi:hypothetical protein
VKTRHFHRSDAARRPDWRGDWLRVALLPVAAALIAMTLLSVAGIARAATYKWVDDKGVVHYSDKVPPEAVDKNRVELNAQGVPIRKTDRALTPEQLRAKEQEDARAREIAKQREGIARRDRALMASYTTEKDIDLARDRALRTLEASIQSAEAYAAQLQVRQTDASAKKAGYADKPVPPAIERELESIAAETNRQSELIAQKKKDAEGVKARYEADRQRWRELIAAKASAEPSSSTPLAAAPESGGYPVLAPSKAAGKK